ncbi:Glycosyl hydrolase family 32, C-terminal [Dillenia turbinata]|uniref:Glycosyl hydrolase family 32, C-terminal n=1 Tax=Dillenia turbinata TaxID=194707 RepID=A0AAN8W3F6_9MAGN
MVGPMYYKGLYHLFYQYNPKGAVWGNIVWAHSVSKDLINWAALEPAIYPSKPFDINGCWSGSATILPGDKPVILYTGIDEDQKQVQNYAIPENTSDQYLRKWIKPDNNPIILTEGVNASAFRDPTTAWWGNGHWKLLVGSRKYQRGMAYLYRSKDFIKWVKSKHPLHSKALTGMWECPDFFPVLLKGANGLDTSIMGPNVKHVLKVSLDVTRYEYYTVGTYIPAKDVYVPDNTSEDGWGGLRYDYGNFYASKSFYDPAKHRRILWVGLMSLIPLLMILPRVGLEFSVPVKLSNYVLEKGNHVQIKGITAAQADVEVNFSIPSLDKAEPFDSSWINAQDLCGLKGSTVQGGVGPFGLLTLASEHLEEYTPVFFRIFRDGPKHKVLLCSDARSSSLRKDVYKPSFAGFVDVDLSDRKLSLRSLIDRSVVESFGAGGKTCISSRVYPTLAIMGSANLYAFNNGSEAITIEKLTAWSMGRPRMN